jgi:hypothetical protein
MAHFHQSRPPRQSHHVWCRHGRKWKKVVSSNVKVSFENENDASKCDIALVSNSVDLLDVGMFAICDLEKITI